MKLGCLSVLLVLARVCGECPPRCQCSRSLHYIRCDGASLGDIPQFSRSFPITIFNLSGNNITRLKDGTFEGKNITDVSTMDLSSNDIKVVEGGTFRGLGEHLLALSFRNNPRILLPERGFHLQVLIELDLSYCGLTKIRAVFFQETPAIQYLILTGNRLTTFDPRIIQPEKGLDLNHLDLANNEMTTLDPHLMFHQNMEMRIEGNPFHCDCAFRLTYTLFAHRDVPANDQPTCHTPAYLEGVTGGRLLKMDLKCESPDGKELVPSLDGRSWWFLHQWWILILSALVLVCVAGLVFVLHKYKRTLSDLYQTLRSIRVSSFIRLNKSDESL